MVYRAIIFDNDGVLADTEGAAAEHDLIFLNHFGEHNYTIHEYAKIMEGKSAKDYEEALRKDWLARTGKQLPDDFMSLLKEQHEWQVKNVVSEVPGVGKMVEAFRKAGMPMAVASNGEMGSLQAKLEKVSLYDAFMPHVYNKDHVAGHGKPKPDLFLFAMKQLGIQDPAECIVVGDTRLDMIAARAANMYAIGYAGGQHRPADYDQQLYDAGANVVFNAMSSMEPFVMQMIKPRAVRAITKLITPPAP